MTVSTVLAALLGVGVLVAACVAAITDIRHRRISNRIVLVVAALALAKSAMGGWEMLAWSGLHALVALIVGMVLFSVRWVGGGDAKFYAAFALAIPWEGALSMLGWSSIGGLLLIAIMMVGRRMAGEPMMPSKSSSWSVPYGVAIFIGGAATSIQGIA